MCSPHIFSTVLKNGGTLAPSEIKHNILPTNPYLCTTSSRPISLDAAPCLFLPKPSKKLLIREVNLFKTELSLENVSSSFKERFSSVNIVLKPAGIS